MINGDKRATEVKKMEKATEKKNERMNPSIRRLSDRRPPDGLWVLRRDMLLERN